MLPFGEARSGKTNGRGGNSVLAQAAVQADFDRKLVLSLSKSRIPSLAQMKHIKRFLSRRELWCVRACFAVIILSSAWWGARFYLAHLETVPIAGGDYAEALIGQPKYINPVYAAAGEADYDLSRLIYSSLFRRGKNGDLVGDLVKSYAVSDDGKTYDLTLKDGVKWHDTELLPRDLNTDDVVYTFNTIKDAQYNSPLRTAFTGVTIARVDGKNFKFILSEPYAAFLELLTFGIMPVNLWYKVSPESFGLTELNLKPIGSGQYKFSALTKNSAGRIVEYSLVPNTDYYGAVPLVNINFRFYSGFEEAIAALNDNEVGGISYLPREMRKNIIMPNTVNFYKLRLPQITAIFFNQANNVSLKEKTVRQALALALNKNEIISDVFGGDAYAVDGPILPDNFAYDADMKKYAYDPREALKLLTGAGWQLSKITEDDVARASSLIEAASSSAEQGGSEEGPDGEERRALAEARAIVRMGPGKWQKKNDSYLTIKLTSVDKDDNNHVMSAVRNAWLAIGVKTEVEALPASRLQTEVIKSKGYEALLYGQMVGADPDQYTLWHSSQTKEGGSNLANYTDKDVDRLLEDARMTSDQNLRRGKYAAFQETLAEELPAIFLYSQFYIYVQDKKIKNFDVKNISLPRDRFANVAEWYIKTGKKLVW